MFTFKLRKQCRRLAKISSRNDFLSTVVKGYEEGTVSKEEMTAHASTLMYVYKLIKQSHHRSLFCIDLFLVLRVQTLPRLSWLR